MIIKARYTYDKIKKKIIESNIPDHTQFWPLSHDKLADK